MQTENVKKFTSDIDIDVANRDDVLKLIKHTPASMLKKGQFVKHLTGIYVTDVPVDPITGMSTIDYEQAEQLGYVKLDILNQSVYEQVKDPAHLDKLLSTEPMWEMLQYKEFVEQIVHINNHYDTIQRMPEPINNIPRMAMLLAIIRPAKRHLIGKTWKEVGLDVWTKPADDAYYFKKSHAVSYAHLVKVHMNLLCGV
jgi:hypothetical protein